MARLLNWHEPTKEYEPLVEGWRDFAVSLQLESPRLTMWLQPEIVYTVHLPEGSNEVKQYYFTTTLDPEDIMMLNDNVLMAHVAAAERAHAQANAGEHVDWPSIIRDHIVQ